MATGKFGHELLSFLFHFVHKNLSTLDPAPLDSGIAATFDSLAVVPQGTTARESKVTRSVPQLDTLVRFAPKVSQSSFDSRNAF